MHQNYGLGEDCAEVAPYVKAKASCTTVTQNSASNVLDGRQHSNVDTMISDPVTSFP